MYGKVGEGVDQILRICGSQRPDSDQLVPHPQTRLGESGQPARVDVRLYRGWQHYGTGMGQDRESLLLIYVLYWCQPRMQQHLGYGRLK